MSEGAEEASGRPASSSRRSFLKIGLLSASGGVALATAAELPFYGSLLQQKDSQAAALQAQAQQGAQLQSQVDQLTTHSGTLQTQLSTVDGFLSLNIDEQSLLEAVAEVIIPTDSNGPGAKEAGVIYFIDRQLAADYGTSGTMYMQGPFVSSGLPGPVTVDGITYANGTPAQSIDAGTRYQYAMNLRYFWHYGLLALQDYSTSAYEAIFQQLSSDDQASVLKDIWANKPTSFYSIVPMDFAYELFFMVWSGFLTDPLYGGNRNMVGWTLVGFSGTNQGNFYGEGQSLLALAQASAPTRLGPASLAQFQQRQASSSS